MCRERKRHPRCDSYNHVDAMWTAGDLDLDTIEKSFCFQIFNCCIAHGRSNIYIIAVFPAHVRPMNLEHRVLPQKVSKSTFIKCPTIITDVLKFVSNEALPTL